MLALIELIAVLSSAVYGVLLATRKEFDLVGISATALVIAFGGGTLRDLFLDRHPLYWIANDHYVAAVLLIVLAGAILPNLFHRFERYLKLPDALGLAMYSIAGAGYAIQAGTSMLIAAILGVVTGTFGGVIAEVICNEIPSLFRAGVPLYATCSFVGCWVYLILARLGAPPSLAVWTGIGVVIVIRLVALRWNLHLPSPGSRKDN